MSALSSLAVLAGAAVNSYNAAKATYEAANLYDRAAENAFSSFAWAKETAISSIDANNWAPGSGDMYIISSTGETAVAWTGAGGPIVCQFDKTGAQYPNFGHRLADFAANSGSLP
jgi:hypothetical protein